MLRVTQQEHSEGAKSYYARADYYTEGQEIVGQWGGQGARRLGLEGTVDKASFDRLCDNLNPVDGKPLTARTRSDRTVGYDFQVSVCKSVSELYSRTGDSELVEAVRSAWRETMTQDIEPEMKTRVRRRGKDEDRVTGNMLWAEFVHTTSRPVDGVPDPQLHIHSFVFNATRDDQEEQWKAGQFRQLKANAPHYEAAFRVRLAGKLQDLGYALRRKGNGDFEIAGVPESLIRKRSRRTDRIEEEARRRGITSDKEKDKLGALTRERKDPELTWEELQRRWDESRTEEERRALDAVQRRVIPAKRIVGGERAAVDYAIEHCFTRKAVVSVRELETAAMKRGVLGVTVEGVRRELARRPLLRGVKDGGPVVTTEAVLAEEQQVVAFVRKGRGKCRPLGDPGRPFTRDWLKAGQRERVRYVLASRDRVMTVDGVSGSGKTTLMQEAAEAIAEGGKQLVVLAPGAGTVFDVLRKDFPEANTVARFLVDRSMQEKARGQVIWMDEAGQLGTEDMLKLFRKAEELKARVVLAGDRRQHRSVARGEPLRLLEQRAGLDRVTEASEILRQSGEYKRAVGYLSAGRAADGFAVLDGLGWIREVADGGRYQQLASAYLAAVKEKNAKGEPASALVISPTWAEAARITGEIRGALKAEGKLGEEKSILAWVPAHLTAAEKGDETNYQPGDLLQFHQNAPGHKRGSRLVVSEGATLPLQHVKRFEVYRPVTLTLAVGDRARVTVNGWDKSRKHRLNNGDLVTVAGFTPAGDVIDQRGWVIPTAGGAHLAMGYVVTSQASQGKTVDKIIIGQSSQSLPATNLRQFYVSVGRGRTQALVFTDSKKELLKAVQCPDEPMSAMELVESGQAGKPLRERLRKHLAFMRRRAAFKWTHGRQLPGPERTPPLDHDRGR